MALNSSYSFARGTFDNSLFSNLPRQKDLATDATFKTFAGNYAQATSLLSKHLSVEDTLKISRFVLGDDLLRKLLQKGGSDVLHVAAEVIDDQLNRPHPLQEKDLQLNMACNMIKEIVTQQDLHTAHYCQAAEQLMDKLGMVVTFRKEIENALLNSGAIYRSFLVIMSVKH